MSSFLVGFGVLKHCGAFYMDAFLPGVDMDENDEGEKYKRKNFVTIYERGRDRSWFLCTNINDLLWCFTIFDIVRPPF